MTVGFKISEIAKNIISKSPETALAIIAGIANQDLGYNGAVNIGVNQGELFVGGKEIIISNSCVQEKGQGQDGATKAEKDIAWAICSMAQQLDDRFFFSMKQLERDYLDKSQPKHDMHAALNAALG